MVRARVWFLTAFTPGHCARFPPPCPLRLLSLRNRVLGGDGAWATRLPGPVDWGRQGWAAPRCARTRSSAVPDGAAGADAPPTPLTCVFSFLPTGCTSQSSDRPGGPGQYPLSLTSALLHQPTQGRPGTLLAPRLRAEARRCPAVRSGCARACTCVSTPADGACVRARS